MDANNSLSSKIISLINTKWLTGKFISKHFLDLVNDLS